jgi:hypothetical protein
MRTWAGVARSVGWSAASAIACAVLLAANSAAVPVASGGRLRLHLSCASECFETYLARELSYFDLVRDRFLADYALLIAAQATNAGGLRYRIELFATHPPGAAGGGERRAPLVRLLVRPADESGATFRAHLRDEALRLLHLALLGTQHEAAFTLGLPPHEIQRLSQLRDSWDGWVVTPELTGEGQGSSGYHSLELTSAVTLRRITYQDKFRLHLSYARQLTSYRLEGGERLSGDTTSTEANLLYAASLGGHVGAGLTATARSSRFENLRLHAHWGPAVEVNVFPYSENAVRQLRFVYQVGVWYNDYFELTASDRWRELRHYHALSGIVDLNQPWGSMQLAGQLNSFVTEPELLRLAFGAHLSLFLLQGFALQFEGRASWVHDQLQVRKRAPTDEEVILFTAEQPTSLEFDGSIGFSYTFGSPHVAIVNPRFGRIDLNED